MPDEGAGPWPLPPLTLPPVGAEDGLDGVVEGAAALHRSCCCCCCSGCGASVDPPAALAVTRFFLQRKVFCQCNAHCSVTFPLPSPFPGPPFPSLPRVSIRFRLAAGLGFVRRRRLPCLGSPSRPAGLHE